MRRKRTLRRYAGRRAVFATRCFLARSFGVKMLGMMAKTKQRLVAWSPREFAASETPYFGEIDLQSPDFQTVRLDLPCEEGKLRLLFKDVRALMTSWDGDPNPFVTFEEAAARPGPLAIVEESRWLASDSFALGVESSGVVSSKPWMHFYILADGRAVHIAARDDIEATWIPGRWSGGVGDWTFAEQE